MDNLRNEILNKTWEHKIPPGKTVSRTFYVPLSEEIQNIKTWYARWFPLKDSCLENIYIWLPFGNSQDNQKDSLQAAWPKALGADTLNEITTRGFLLRDSSVQVIFLVDLSKKSGFNLLKSTKKIFDEIINESSTNATIFFSCIAILRNFDEETKRFLNPESIHEFFKWSQENLHRLYAVDIQNLHGTFISSSSDMHFFLGQLLNYITLKPVEAPVEGDNQNFAEWIGRVNAGDNKATAFSATSFVFPVDYVLEVCLVQKGTEQIEKALFSDPDNQRVQFYLNSLKNQNGLNSHSVFREHVFSERAKKPGEDPSDYINEILKSNSPKSIFDDIELRLFAYKKIDSLLPEMANKISIDYADQVSNVSLSFHYSLLEQFDKVLNEESGSMGILKQTFDELNKHLSKLKPEEAELSSIGDIDALFENLEKEKLNAPSDKAVISRAIIMVVLSMVTVLEFLRNGNFVFIILTSLFFVLTVAYLAYNWFASKRRIEKLFLQIEHVINKKWQFLKTTVQNKLIENIKDKSLSHLRDAQIQTKRVAKRFEEIVDFGKNDYDPPKPVGSAFWMNAINTREEALGFADRIMEPAKLKPLGVFKEKGSAELWSRLSFSGGKELNDWEMSILEKAAIDLLPDAEPLLNLSVCDVLGTNPGKLRTLKVVLSNYCEPFTAINRLHISDSDGILETPDSGCKDVRDSILQEISKQFQKMHKKNSGSKYRISFLSFAEGLDYKKILETLKKQI